MEERFATTPIDRSPYKLLKLETNARPIRTAQIKNLGYCTTEFLMYISPVLFLQCECEEEEDKQEDQYVSTNAL